MTEHYFFIFHKYGHHGLFLEFKSSMLIEGTPFEWYKAILTTQVAIYLS